MLDKPDVSNLSNGYKRADIGKDYHGDSRQVKDNSEWFTEFGMATCNSFAWKRSGKLLSL